VIEADEVQKRAREQFGKQSHRYAKGHILGDTKDVQAALDLIEIPSRAKVLDVATGAGFTGMHLARLGHDVTLADIARPMLERAQEQARELGLQVEVAEHAAEKLPYPDSSFDLVTCRVAAHHFSSPDQFVTESARVLKAGGHFLLIDGTVQDHAPIAEEWMHQVEKFRDPSHHRFVTPLSWEKLCHGAELRVIHCGLTPFKQPDLNWYFETAATSPENRERVLELVRSAPPEARQIFKLGEEEGKIVWWWQRLTLVARKEEGYGG
jgi:ubiquinone/menaquinone biosynthesis C-methylase UbiE